MSLSAADAPHSDSGIFASVAYHALNGRALYREVWDHKPPMVYLIDAAGLKTAGGIDGVHRVESVFAAALGGVFFLIVLDRYKNLFTAVFSTLLCLAVFYLPQVFEYGNFTEEYGAVFMVIGIFFASIRWDKEKPSEGFAAFLSGGFFCLSALTKEPFIFSAIPWALYIALNSMRRLRAILFFALGVLIPSMVFLWYLVSVDALYDWIDIISFNFNYAGDAYNLTQKNLFTRFFLSFLNDTFTGCSAIADVLFTIGLLSSKGPVYDANAESHCHIHQKTLHPR